MYICSRIRVRGRMYFLQSHVGEWAVSKVSVYSWPGNDVILSYNMYMSRTCSRNYPYFVRLHQIICIYTNQSCKRNVLTLNQVDIKIPYKDIFLVDTLSLSPYTLFVWVGCQFLELLLNEWANRKLSVVY